LPASWVLCSVSFFPRTVQSFVLVALLCCLLFRCRVVSKFGSIRYGRGSSESLLHAGLPMVLCPASLLRMRTPRRASALQLRRSRTATTCTRTWPSTCRSCARRTRSWTNSLMWGRECVCSRVRSIVSRSVHCQRHVRVVCAFVRVLGVVSSLFRSSSWHVLHKSQSCTWPEV
jgi:hypothetical protein